MMYRALRRIEDLRGVKITVMGLGLNGGGLESARFLARSGALVTVTDMKDESALSESLKKLEGLDIRFVLGRHELEDFSRADIVIKNPAVPPDSPYLGAAPMVETDISLFLRFSRSPLIAVTGSKGKSSVSSAIHHGLVQAGKRAFLGGNITISPLSFISETDEDSPVVLELSSWQLADMRGLGVLRPKTAVLTSIMPDHMNRYTSMESYVADKRLIYADQSAQDCTICNKDEDWGRSFAAETRARVLWYGDGNQGLPGAWLSEDGRGFFSESADSAPELILGAKLDLPGAHQRRNLLAAALALKTFGLEGHAIMRGMASFPGVEHRLELFADKNGVRWYNDSAATIPQALGAAIDSMDRPTVLITGGTDKNLDFSPIRRALHSPERIILLEGSGSEKLMRVLREEGIDWLGPFADLDSAVSAALPLLAPNRAVLFSPGCTSFGMFLHEFDRGRQFKNKVRQRLAKD